MIAQIASAVLPALFIGSGALALGVLGHSWRTYGGAWRRLRNELALCDDVQMVGVTVTRHDVRVFAAAAGSARPVRRAALRQPARGPVSLARRPALPAAA